MAEEDIDTETLQAQIDMSLSFAQDLVSSWIKPLGSSSTKATSSKDAEKELEEILRRPARLGVGAPLPETVGVSGRDTARLKNKLAGSKRPREEYASTSKADGRVMDEDDDAEESRAGAIRKKVKADPFQMKKKKKGKGKELNGKTKEEEDARKISTESVLDGKELGEEVVGANENKVQNKAVSEAMDVYEDVDDQTVAKPTEPKRKKKKKKHITANPAVDPGADTPEDALHTSPSHSTVTPARPAAPVSSPPSSSSNVPTSTLHSTTPATPKPPLSAKRNPFVLPDAPVLNLSGPPPDIDSHNAQTDQTSPKKKRKRKKKKKAKVEPITPTCSRSLSRGYVLCIPVSPISTRLRLEFS